MINNLLKNYEIKITTIFSTYLPGCFIYFG